MSRAAFAPAEQPDVVLITDPSEAVFLSEAERQMLVHDLGVRIVHSDAYRAFNASGNIMCTGGNTAAENDFLRINILKIEAFCLPYRAVYYLDIDNFVVKIAPNFWDLVAANATTCHSWGGSTSPMVGHEFLITPSPESCQRLRTTLAGGFRRATGWGNAGPIPVWENCNCPRNTTMPFCRSVGLPVPSTGPFPRKCATATGMTDWGFFGSCTDQGILYWECAIATTTGHLPAGNQFDRRISARHFFGNNKPWLPTSGRPTLAPTVMADYERALATANRTVPLFSTLCAALRPTAASLGVTARRA